MGMRSLQRALLPAPVKIAFAGLGGTATRPRLCLYFFSSPTPSLNREGGSEMDRVAGRGAAGTVPRPQDGESEPETRADFLQVRFEPAGVPRGKHPLGRRATAREREAGTAALSAGPLEGGNAKRVPPPSHSMREDPRLPEGCPRVLSRRSYISSSRTMTTYPSALSRRASSRAEPSSDAPTLTL